MTIRDSVYITYAGQRSYDKGILNVNVTGGMYDEPVSGARNVQEDRNMGGERFLRNVDEDNLEFDITLYFEDNLSREKVRDITRWLLQDRHQPLIFNEHPDRIFYAVAEGSYRLIHNGVQEGYLELSFRCNAPHAFSPTYQSPTFNLTGGRSVHKVEFENLGDKDVSPILFIHKIGDGDIEIKNLSDNGKITKIRNLVNNERIEIDSANNKIKSNTDLNRYNDFNYEWFNLVYGLNHIEVTGSCNIYYVCQFKIY